MYSPTARLLTVLQLLQSYKEMSGSEIARRLDINPRTVRRYIERLQEMGIPVEAERGPYGTYQLQRGYKLPPLMFTDAEAVAITLGLLAIRELRFPVDVASVEGALAKTERVMPENLLSQARGLQEAIMFNVSTPPPLLNNDFLATLSSAVQQRQQVHLSYSSYNGDTSERDFDPYGIVFNEGYWYTAGYCHLRRDLRTFRLDRVVDLTPLTTAFDRPDDFNVLQHVMQSLSTWTTPDQVEVLMQTTLEHAQEMIPSVMGTVEATPDGILFRRAPYQLEWVAHVLIMLDFPIKVINPPELLDMIRQLATRASQIVSA